VPFSSLVAPCVFSSFGLAWALSGSLLIVGQGRVSGPSRSKSVAAKIQHAINKVVRGYLSGVGRQEGSTRLVRG
jgi:hypothetical protein